MTESIKRVIDPFTRNGGTIPRSRLDSEREKLFDQLRTAVREEKHLTSLVARVGSLIKESIAYEYPANSMLPTVSLYHHMKVTAAVAGCLTYDEMFDDTERDVFVAKMRLAGWFHDLGKLHATDSDQNHGTPVMPFLKELATLNPGISLSTRTAQRHHLTPDDSTVEGENSQAKMDSIWKRILTQADSIASASERRSFLEATLDKNTNILSITNNDPVFPHTHVEVGGQRADYEPKSGPAVISIPRGETVKLEVTHNGHSTRLYYDPIQSGGTSDYQEVDIDSGNIRLLAVDTMGIQSFIKEAKKLPLIRSASHIVKHLTETTLVEIVSRVVGPECILFAGGGNALALLPTKASVRQEIEESYETQSGGGLMPSIVESDIELYDLKHGFQNLMKNIHDALELEKNRPSLESPVKALRSDELCGLCKTKPSTMSIKLYENDRTSTPTCNVCEIKMKHKGIAKRDLYRDLLDRADFDDAMLPNDMGDLGSRIALVSLDGNMMGRFFINSLTPSEYTFKSDMFDRNIKSIIRECVRENIGLLKKGNTIQFQPILMGGDDITFICGANAAVPFTVDLQERVNRAFSMQNDSMHMVTLSAGIAFSSSSFPIYFLMDRSESLLKEAKKAFRKQCTRENGVMIPLYGAVTMNVVSDTMVKSTQTPFLIKNNGPIHLLSRLVEDFVANNRKELIGHIRRLPMSMAPGKPNTELLLSLKELHGNMSRKKIDIGSISELDSMVQEHPEVIATFQSIAPVLAKEGKQ